jgi:hypothetical protein
MNEKSDSFQVEAASESSRLFGEGSYISVYILLITSVLLISACCRWYLRRGVIDV